MKRIIKLTESDLARIVRRVIKEQSNNEYQKQPGMTSYNDQVNLDQKEKTGGGLSNIPVGYKPLTSPEMGKINISNQTASLQMEFTHKKDIAWGCMFYGNTRSSMGSRAKDFSNIVFDFDCGENKLEISSYSIKNSASNRNVWQITQKAFDNLKKECGCDKYASNNKQSDQSGSKLA